MRFLVSIRVTSRFKVVINHFVGFWTHSEFLQEFCKNVGDPNGGDLPQWPPWQAAPASLLNISNQPVLAEAPKSASVGGSSHPSGLVEIGISVGGGGGGMKTICQVGLMCIFL